MRLIDVGINTSDIEVRFQRDGAEVIESDEDNAQIPHLHIEVPLLVDTIEQVHVPHSDQSTSRYVPESTRSSGMSAYDTGTRGAIPQLDGPISVPSRSQRRSIDCMRNELDSDPRTTTSHRREYPGDDSDDSHNNR